MRPDFSVLPADLAALYSGRFHNVETDVETSVDQLTLPVEPAEAEFRRWLEAQPLPDYIEAAAS